MKSLLRLFIFIVVATSNIAGADESLKSDQSAHELIGIWEAHRDFGPQVQGELTIRNFSNELRAEIAGYTAVAESNGSNISFGIADDRGSFRGQIAADGSVISGHWIQPPTRADFVRFATPVRLVRIDQTRWRGTVQPKADRMTFYLRLSGNGDGTISGFLRNPESNFGRFFPIRDVKQSGHTVVFVGHAPEDTSLVAEYDAELDVLSVNFYSFGGTYDFNRVDAQSASRFFPRSPELAYKYAPPLREDDGWAVMALEDVKMSVKPIEDMVQTIINTPMDSIASPDIHAVLIARNGKLVLEEYFHGFTRDVPHQTRSASKSVTSTMIGIAINDGLPISLSTPVYETIYGGEIPPTVDERAHRITLRHLLTMSSCLACDDWNPDSPGNEDRMQGQEAQDDWVQYTIDLPMLCEPGDTAWYCSASPHLASALLGRISDQWLPDFFQNQVARPLQIADYHINLTPTGDAYGGGGLYVTGRDFMKFGQLFLNDGSWNGRKLLGDDWVRNAVSPSLVLGSEGYGYGWWIIEYPFRDRTVKAFYAGGNGGQYIIGVPELDLLVTFFAGNYSQRVMHQTKREYVPKFILKAVE